MSYRRFSCLFLLCFSMGCFNIYAVDWLITNSGNYILADDILANGDATNGTIRIQSSYVNLDLNGRFIRQTDATANSNGIVIDAGVTDVTIRNGTVRGFTRAGIAVGAGCSVIKLQDLNVDACAIRGIDFPGTVGSNITESSILNCKIINGCTSASAVNALNLSFCQRISVSDTVISNNGGAGATLFASVILLADSSSCKFANLNINSNTSASFFVGIQLSATNAPVLRSYFSNCIMTNNTSTAANGSFAGFALNGQTAANFVGRNVFDNCQILNNSVPAAGGQFRGFSFINFCIGNIIRSCIVSGNSSGNLTIGYHLNSTNANNNVFTDCVAISNSVNTNIGDVNGFRLTNGNNNIILRCVASYNQSTVAGGTASGIYFVTGTPSFNEIKDCEIMGNNGTTNATSFGIRRLVGTNNLFSRNICFNNGPVSPVTLANQTIGVAAGAVSVSTTVATLNAPTAPWTNFRLTN